eukprot:gene10208-7152_t
MKTFCCVLLGAAASSWLRPVPKTAECSTSKGPFSTTDYRPFTLLSYSDESHNTRVFRFALPEGDMPLNLVPACCLMLRCQGNNGEEIVRPYTPISRSDQRGYFEIVVKNYKDSKMGQHLFSLKQGETVEVKGPVTKLAIRPNQYKSIGMIAGGTGIAPMYQVARHLLTNPKNNTEISLIYSNKRREDVLLGNELNELMRNFPKFSPYFMLSKAPRDWMGGIGHINKDVIRALMPPPQQAGEAVILVCGPPTFMTNISGDKDYRKSPPGQGELRGYLKELGYLAPMVYKF